MRFSSSVPCHDDYASFDSQDENHLGDVAWGRFFTFYSLLVLLAVATQWVVQCNISRCHQMIAYDSIATFVVYGCMVCHSYTSHLYGPLVGLSTYFVVNIGFVYILVGSASPLPKVMSLMTCCDQQERDILSWRVGANIVAGLVSHPFSKVLLKQLNYDVNPRLLERLHCSPSPVNIPLGVGSEFVGTLLVCALFASSMYCLHFEAYDVAVKVFVDCFTLSLGMHDVSVNLNPALAGSQSIGCGRQADVIQGISVHGFTPLAAAILFVKYSCCQFSGPCECPPHELAGDQATSYCASPCPTCGPPFDSACSPCTAGGQVNSCCLVPQPAQKSCTSSPFCNDKITAQVKQSKSDDGKRRVDYVIFFPPMCTEKGIRLRHKFVIDKDEVHDDGGKSVKSDDKLASKNESKIANKLSQETSDGDPDSPMESSPVSSTKKPCIKPRNKAQAGDDTSKTSTTITTNHPDKKPDKTKSADEANEKRASEVKSGSTLQDKATKQNSNGKKSNPTDVHETSKKDKHCEKKRNGTK